MRKLLVVAAVLSVVAGFVTSGWLLWDSRSREQVLAERLSELEAKMNQDQDLKASLVAIGTGTASALQRVENLEKASFFGKVPTSVRVGDALTQRLTAVEFDLDMVRKDVDKADTLLPVVDTTESDITLLQGDVRKLESRVGSICRAWQANVDGVLFC